MVKEFKTTNLALCAYLQMQGLRYFPGLKEAEQGL